MRTTADLERESEQLQRRIDVYAAASVKHAKLAIADAIRPILADVPPVGDPRAAELGPGLLVAFEQLRRALAAQGINF